MKAAWAVLLVVLTAALIAWMRAEHADFALPQALPFLGGYEPSFFDVAGSAMLFICILGLVRMKRGNDKR